MAAKQFSPQYGGDIVHDIHDLIFRLNCKKYFETKRKIDVVNENGVREFHPRSSINSNELLRDLNGEKQKINYSSSSDFKVTTVPGIIHNDNVKELSSPDLPIVQKSGFHSEMGLAVDATPTRVGGLLRLPGSERTIFYYSVSWTTHFEFEDSTKFEMVNAALALELFKPYLKAYRERYDKLIVKTDNNFYGSMKGFKDPLDVTFLLRIRNEVECLRGEFHHVCVSQKDADIQNADYLSRTELPIGLKFEYVESNSEEFKAARYALVDLSAVARGHTLDIIKDFVPRKYIKGYCRN